MGGKHICFLTCILGYIHLLGCSTTNTLYDWGDYEKGLYGRYVAENQELAEAYLLENIRHAEQGNLKVPPGVYADYGFALFKRGDANGAIAYFEKEKRAFPEATALMDKLIDKVRQKSAGLTEKQPQTSPLPGAKP